jgi:hypothetical protein
MVEFQKQIYDFIVDRVQTNFEHQIYETDFQLFPWNEPLWNYIATLYKERAHLQLAMLFEMAGSMGRTMYPNEEETSYYTLHIAPLLTQCACMHYYKAGENELAHALATLNVAHLKRVLSKLNPTDVVAAIVTESMADMHWFIDYQVADEWYEKSWCMFELYGDEEMGETHDWYWYQSETVLNDSIRACLDIEDEEVYIVKSRIYTDRIPFKRTIQKHFPYPV